MTDALGNLTTRLYDKMGNATAVIDARGYTTEYDYDDLYRLTTVEDALGNTRQTQYDAVGNVTGVVDGNGNATEYVYNALNRATVTIDANDFRTTSVLDANGNVTSITDALNNETTFAYDQLDRKVSETDPHGNEATFAYNGIALMTGTTDRVNRERVFEYDAVYRMTTQIWKDSGGTPVETLIYSFDDNGNMLSAADSDGAYTMTYDALNRVDTAKDMWGHTLTFTYNAVGHRTKVEDSLGGVVTSTYNEVGNLTKREFKDGTPELRIDFAYSATNQVTDITRFSDLSGTTKVATSSFSHDDAGRLENLHHKDGSSTNIANYTFTFDPQGNLETETLNGSTTTYTHDDTNQLTDDGTNSFTYDGTGNRTNTGYSTGTGNQIISDGTWTFSYDDEGNMVKKSKGVNDETWTYGYDHRNQMTWVEQRETYGGTLMMRADYEYDVFGNRIEKEVDEDGNSTVDLTERYAYDGWRPGGGFVGNENWDIWADLDDSSSLTTLYVRGDAIDEVFARIESDDSIYWLLTDRLGSVRDVTDNSGTVKDTIVYDGFGNITSESDSNYRGRYAWTGRELDVETELQYNRRRYYDATIGRWTSQDPIGFGAGDSNLYRYVGNNATNATDPTGLQEQDPYQFLRMYDNRRQFMLHARRYHSASGWHRLMEQFADRFAESTGANAPQRQWIRDATFLRENGWAYQAIVGALGSPPPGRFYRRRLGGQPTIEQMPYLNHRDLPRAFDENVDGREAAEMAQNIITYEFPIVAGQTTFYLAMAFFPVGRGVSLSARLLGAGFRIVARNGVRVLAQTTGRGLHYLNAAEARMVLSRLVQLHHPIPRIFRLGGDQVLYALSRIAHTGRGARSFHNMLRAALRRRGITRGIGGPGGSAADWADDMTRNPNLQRQILDSILEASREFDRAYGTRVTQHVWENIMRIGGNQFNP